MRQLVSILVLAILSTPAFANDFAAVLGLRTNSWDISPSTGVTAGGKTGYQAGVLGFIDLAQALSLRTGFLYTQRNYTVKATGSTEVEYNYSYFDIPATLMYKFSDYGGVFAGAVFALNSGKSCNGTGCSTDGVKSSLMGLQFGASFKFAPQLGAEFYYEMISGDIQADSGIAGKDSKSVVANLLFTFE